MSPSRSEIAQGRNLADCIAELSLRLANVVREGRTFKRSPEKPHCFKLRSDHALFIFSTPLLRALLTESPKSSALDRFLAFIDQQRDTIIHALEMVSLRGLAQYLLKSPSDDSCEMGLFFLLSEPRCITDTASMSAEIKIPQWEGLLQLAQEYLVQRAYTLFTNHMSNARLRRMAGKVLAELLHESQNNFQYIAESDDQNSSRTIINALGGSDTISSFFASAILQEFCRSKQNDVSSWELDDSHSRIRDHLRPEGNPVEQYYSYVRTERQTPSFERVALPVYCLLESDGKDKSGLPQGLVLLGMNEGRLDFLHCNNDGAGRIFTYMVLRTTRSSTTRCSVSSAHGEKLLLSLHIGPGDSLKINERKQHFQVVTFRMAIEYDLTILRRGFEATGIRSQSHRGPRRSSSLMIPLDNLDEINQIDEMSTRTSSSSLAKTMTDQATYGCPSRDELSDHIDQPDHVSETTNESASESPLTELTLTPTACTTSSPRKQRSAQPSSHGFGQGRLEKRPEPKKLAISLPSPQNQQAKISHINEAGNIEEAVDSSKRQAIVSEPALNTRSKSSQSEEIMSTSTRSSIMRLNTQESLLFPMHRPKGKLYTSLSKTVVGRAENPKTCQDSVQKGQHEDLELTSVPCPTSGGTSSSLNKNSNTSRKNTKSDSKPKVQTKGRKKGKKKMQPIRNAKPDSPSSIVDSVANDKAQNGRQANTFAKALKHDIATNDPEIDSSPLPEMSDTLKDSIDARTLPKHTRRKALGASIPSKQDWATGLAVADSRSSVKPEASGEQFRTTSTKSFSDQPQSSGQRAAVKLIAVLEESGILSENLDGSREIEIVNGPRDRLNQREPYTQSQVLYEGDKQGTSRFQTAEKRQQGTTMNEPHFAASLGGTQDSSLYAGTEQGQPTRNPRKRASIFENKNGHEAKRTRKTSSLLTTSSVEPWSTASTFQYRHTSSRTQPRERGRTIRPFHEISGNAVSLGANTNMPAVSHPETSDDIPIGDGFEKGRLSSERPVQSSKQKTYDRAGICLEPGPKTMIDKNGSPWRSQGNGEQVISQREAPISTKTTGRVHKDTDFVSKAPHVVTSRVEKQFLFPSGEGLSAVPQAISNESPDLEQEKRLDNGNLDQGAESQISSTNRWPLNRVGTDSKPALELTADAAHRQTLLEELHREIEKRLLSTDEQLHRHIEAERMVVSEVLDGYRNTLKRVIKAQTERISLCQQQKESIMRECTFVGQNIGPRLEEDLENAV